MVENPNHALINMYPQLDNPMHFRLNEINEIIYCFMSEICERETMSKTLSKYTAVFDYFDKTLLVLSATGGGVSIISFVTVIGASVGITITSLSLVFSISNGNFLKKSKTKRKKKKKHIKIVLLAKSNLNSKERIHN